MIFNITDDIIILNRADKNFYYTHIPELLSAFLYFENVYIEHMIDDEFEVGIPYVEIELLYFKSYFEFVMYNYTENFFHKLDPLLKLIYRNTRRDSVYDIKLNNIGSNYILDVSLRGNVLELRYEELLYNKKKGYIKWKIEV